MNTTISISKDTREILREYGKKSQSYDDIIKEMHEKIVLREAVEEYVNENEWFTIDEARKWTVEELKKERK